MQHVGKDGEHFLKLYYKKPLEYAATNDNKHLVFKQNN